MSYALGVDLGTTYTGAAVNRDGHTEMVSLGDRSIVVPAVAFAHESGLLVTGDVAARRALDQPDRSAREFKRRLGDPTPLLLGGTPYSPAILMAAVLRAAVDKATEENGVPPEQIVLTHPAVWGPYRREQFAQVPGLSGLRGITMATEPVAAATYYAATKAHRDDEVIAVYDLGGGTFDATVVRLRDGEAEILGVPEGVEWLGGIDFDEAILNYVHQELHGAVAALNPNDPGSAGTIIRLREECTLAKEALSVEPDVSIRVALPSGESSVRLTREDFEQRIRPALAATIEALHRVLSSAGVTPEDLSVILLIGGSSRIPLVSRMLEATFHRPVAIDAHPKHAVALGAAMIAGRAREPAKPAAERTAKPRYLLAGLIAVTALIAVSILAWVALRGPRVSNSLAAPALSAPSPSAPSQIAPSQTAVTLPPVNGQFDYQIGGAYPPSTSVTVLARDLTDEPVPGKYNICYINAFQTQSDDAAFWTRSHRDLLLKDRSGKYVTDPSWPDEYLLDTSTAAKRAAIAKIVNGWIDDCADKGYQAVDPDNQDSWTRSKGLLTQADSVALSTLLAAHAHSAGMAIGQRNTPELGSIGKTTVKFDFAIAEECSFYHECDAYLKAYGDQVIEVEYTDQPRSAYATACAKQGKEISVTLRDRDLVPKGEPGYHNEHC